MARISSYSKKNFTSATQLLSYDPSSGVTALVPGQTLIDFIGLPDFNEQLINRVQWFSTNEVAKTENLPEGRVIYTAGNTDVADGGGGHYIVVGPSEGSIVLDNGNELLLLPLGDLTGSDATNANVTTATATQTAQGALDDRVIRRETLAELKAIDSTVISGSETLGAAITAGDRAGLFTVYPSTVDFSSQIASDPKEGIYVALTDGGTAVRDTSTGEIDLAAFGIVAGGGPYTLSDVVDLCESENLNITGDATEPNPIEFTDTFNVQHIRFGGNKPLHIRYVGTLDIDEAPVIILGEPDFASYGPARFASTKQYRVGEVLQFSGGTWGDVLFTMGGYVYFHHIPDGGAFPSNGETVNGLSSGRSDTVADIRPLTFTPTNYNGRLKNIFLTTTLDLDGGGLPLSHTQATGIIAHGVRGSRWFGGVHNVVVQGYYNGFIAAHSYFMNFDGFLTTNRCAYGTLLAEENNQINLNNVVNSRAGTPYDSVARRSLRISYSYAIKGFIDTEAVTDTSFQQITACQGCNINGGDIETTSGAHAWDVGGSPALDNVGDPTTVANKLFWSRGITLRGLRASNSLFFKLSSYVDGLSVEDSTVDFNDGSGLATISNILNTSGATNCTGIRFRNVVSKNLDVADEFNSAHTLSDNIVFTDDCYEVLELSDTFYIPTAKSSINMSRVIADSNVSVELLDLSVGNEAGQSPAMDAALFDFDGGSNSWNFELTAATTAPTYGTYRSTTFSGSGRYTDTDGFRMRFTNMRTDVENWYNYTVRMRRLAI